MSHKQRSRGPLLITSWRATRACNLNCLYCNVEAKMEPAPDELTTKETLMLVDQIYEFGSEWFGLKGGEPLARKDVFEPISYARSLGLNICLLTNGWFVDGEIYRNLVRNEVFTSISIDGSEEANDALRGKGSYKAAISAIKKLSDAGILNGLSMAITALNLNEAEHIIALAEEYGAKFVWFNHLLPCGRARTKLQLEPTPEQYELFLNHLYDLLNKTYRRKFDFHIHCPFFARIYKERNPEGFDDWFQNEFTGKCIYFLFGGYLSVLENGDVIPCFYSEGLKIGSIREKTLKQLWSEVQNMEFYKRIKDPNNLKGKCGVCEYKDICGGCRTRAYAHTGDYFESDPACAYMPGGLPKNSLHTCTGATNIAYLKREK